MVPRAERRGSGSFRRRTRPCHCADWRVSRAVAALPSGYPQVPVASIPLLNRLPSPRQVRSRRGSGARWHTHVLSCIPEDTDILAVLSRDQSFREYIACDPFIYVVNTDGSIQYLGLTKEVLSDEQKK